jgi:hypothetical protein
MVVIIVVIIVVNVIVNIVISIVVVIGHCATAASAALTSPLAPPPAPLPPPAPPPPPSVGEQESHDNPTEDRLDGSVQNTSSRPPINMISGRAWSPSVYGDLRLLGNTLDVAWKRAVIHPLTLI